MDTLQELQDYSGVKLTCKHCGHQWISRSVHRPLCCAAQCSRQWYWYLDPDRTPAPRPRKKVTRKKK